MNQINQIPMIYTILCTGETLRHERASGSRNTEDTICSPSQKRPRTEGDFINSKLSYFIGLNFPADFMNQN